MARLVDYNALKARTLGSGTDEEAVTVNTRALIDKVLARYSGEWTVLRELLQNAADATATRVTIKFDTIPSSTIPVPQDATPSNLLKHTVSNHTLKRLVISNNGQAFNDNDWSRLKRIAEGNPDETKIGAFGVGFYSVFAECEEPFVSSGSEAMAFYWKGNSLFTRRLQLSASDSDPDTSFVLDYRNTTSPVPALLPLAQFLASSLTFVGIETIDLWIDNWNIVTFSKKTAPSQEILIPKDIEAKTSEGLMKIINLCREVAQIDGKWMSIVGWKPPRSTASRLESSRGTDNAPSLRNFFSRLAGGSGYSSRDDLSPRANRHESEMANEDWTAQSSKTIFLHVNTATIRTSTSSGFDQELERATKKPPPKTTRLAVLTSPYTANISQQSLIGSSPPADVFATVLPTKNGRIFIGFPTHQTTGLSAHISAPSVIPTVERESIDLNARWVRTWNIEMLRAAGIVCRIAWSAEMTDLKDRIQRDLAKTGKSKIRLEDIASVLPEGVTVSKNFTFRESTPSAQTGQILEDAFWTCNKKASIDVLSTCGVLPTHEVRIAPKDLSFMEGIPVLPDQLMSEAKPFVDKLVEYGLITEITVSDIKKALEVSALSSKQVGEFLAWIGNQYSKGQLDRGTINNLLAVAVANDESKDGSPSRVLVLGSIEYFMNPARIPIDLPVPPSVMPFRLTKNLSKVDLEALGWQELQIVPWLRWLLDEAGNRNVLESAQDITQSPAFSAQVLPVLSRQWESLSQSSRATIVELLSAQTIIPTKLGMKRPQEAYFPSVRLFDDLPVVTGLNGVKDKILLALGVRKTVELGVVFDRLLTEKPAAGANNKPRWSHVDLISYLASVRDDIPAADIQKLKSTPICPKELKNDPQGQSDKRYKVSELFVPKQALRELGLPLIEWPSNFRDSSGEGRFLYMLGLRSAPTVTELISIMAGAAANGNLLLRDKAMNYFLTNHHANGYTPFDYSKVIVPFLPLEGNSTKLSTPSHCFVDGGAALLGFDILRRDLQPHATKFGVRTHPDMDQCIRILLEGPPKSHRDARATFAYFAGRLSEINSSNIPRLSDAKFVPIFSEPPVSPAVASEKVKKPKFISPKNCFLGDSDTYGEIFNFVDFGQEANAFLLKCGSKHEPTKLEVAQILVKEPARISTTFRNPEKYLNLLRSLAESISTLKKNKELFRDMKIAPFLLASKELPATHTLSEKTTHRRIEEIEDLDEEESQGIREWQLASAQDAIIIDDYVSYNLFKNSILAAPQEDTLEDFYYSLGAPLLSTLVDEAARHGPVLKDQKAAIRLQRQIYERSRLFLHEQPPDMIKHDTKWLEKNLNVQAVSSISLRRSLKGRDVSHVEKRSAVITQVNREYTLWIVGDKTDLYQVSQALVHLLLTRPKVHSALTLEMLLKTDLLDLRARGFNVSRILRQQAAEARMAENLRQQQLEEEQKRIKEQEEAWKESQERAAKERAQRPEIPGNFPDSPDSKGGAGLTNGHEDSSELVHRPPRNLLSNLSKQFGFGDGRASRNLSSLLGNSTPAPPTLPNGTEQEPPPPYSQQGPGGKQKQIDGSQTVTAPHQLQENLLSAIKKSRPHNSSALYSRGETNNVSETASYCDEHPSHDLAFVADLQHGIQMFLSPTSVANSTSTSFLSEHATALTAFASLLKDVAGIFALDVRSVNVFFEERGKTIAFNRNGSVFCNYLYFQQLHENRMMKQQQQQLERGDRQAQSVLGQARADALVYWWVILCHELAHNLVADHSSNHSYYTEGFVVQYFGRVMAKVADMVGVNVTAIAN
jgi:hypothetical protein